MQKQQRQLPTISVVITTLVLALVYLIAVLGCEEKSSESTPDTVDNSTAPSTITISTIDNTDTTVVTSNSITISWSAPADFGNAADGKTNATLKDYTVYYIAGKEVTPDTVGVHKTTVKDVTKVKIEGLKAYTEYAFIVVVTNSAGKTTSSEVMKVTTTKANLNDFDLSYEISGNTVFGEENTYTATTTIPAEANATYTIRLTTDGTAVPGISINQADATITVGATTAAGRHDLTVKASAGNDAANYTGTKTVAITIIVSPAASQATAPGKATALTTKDITKTSITLEWVAPQEMGQAADGIAPATFREYKVYYKEGATVSIVDGTVFQGTNTSGQDTITAIISGLKGLTEYAFIVVTVNSEGKSSISETITATTTSAASAPSLATINPIDTIDITKDSIEISWTAPDDLGKEDNGSDATITGYKVYYKVGDTVSVGDGTLLNANTDGGVQTALEATISSLTPVTQYAFIVVTVNSADKTSTSTVNTATTLSAASAPSPAIINPVDANSITTNSITILWTAPVDMGKADDGSDATITGYKVYYKEGDTVSVGDGTLLKNANTDGGVQTALEATISSLTPVTQYAFIVVTVNSADKTSTSTVNTATTLSAATAPSTVTINPIDASTIIHDTLIVNSDKIDVTINSIDISWTAPSDLGKEDNGNTDATLSGYKIYYNEGSTVSTSDTLLNGSTSSNGLQTNTNANISDLYGLTKYAFMVVTINSAGLTSSSIVTYRTEEVLLIKLGANGQTLSVQDGTWSDSGTESAGTKWSCVLDSRGTRNTNDDLYWEIKTNDGGDRDKSKTYKWGGLTAIGINDSTKQGTYHGEWDTLVNAANDASNNGVNGLCGFADWRVPTTWEVTSILDYIKAIPAIDTAMFPYVLTNNYYWMASPETSDSTKAWHQDFNLGLSRSSLRKNAKYVRLVRDGSDITAAEDSYAFDFWSDNRYVDNADGTITDTDTGLMWKQCSEGYSGNDCSTEASTTTFNFDEGLLQATTVNNTGFAGHKDWRVPTMEELKSLAAMNMSYPTINRTMFPNTQYNYRTSFLSSNNSTTSWHVLFEFAFSSTLSTTDQSSVRLVRYAD